MKNIGLIAAGFIAATAIFKGKEILELTKNKYSELKEKAQKKEDTQGKNPEEEQSSPK